MRICVIRHNGFLLGEAVTRLRQLDNGIAVDEVDAHLIDPPRAYELPIRYDLIVLPLSLRAFCSLRIAESVHGRGLSTRLLLISDTKAPRQLLEQLYDSFLPATSSPVELHSALNHLLQRDAPNGRIADSEQLRVLIAAIIATAACFRVQRRVPHHGGISVMDDYDASRQGAEHLKEIEHCFKPTRLYISYVQPDAHHRDRLVQHLSTLVRTNVVHAWHDGKLLPGQRRLDEILQHLSDADIILLLVTPNFLSSDHIWNIDIQIAMTRAEDDDAMVVPVIVEPVRWEDAPFRHLQPLPESGQPVTKWSSEDDAWLSVVEAIRALAAYDQLPMVGKPKRDAIVSARRFTPGQAG
jgi:hypothetical protein